MGVAQEQDPWLAARVMLGGLRFNTELCRPGTSAPGPYAFAYRRST